MLTHRQLWAAIDTLAARYHLSPSGLAKRAGLDPTTFNKSKRTTPQGKERWPSTESLSKVLEATGASLDEFITLVSSADPDGPTYTQPIPFIGFAQAGAGGFFDDGGFPAGRGWDEVRFPEIRDESAYALEVTDDSMEPLYREGEVLIISPNAEIRRNDRVIAETREGKILAKTLERRSAKWVELISLNPNDPNPKLTLPVSDLKWLARIIWASQ